MTYASDQRASAGFSLVEVLVGVTISIILLGAIFTSLASSQLVVGHQMAVSDMDVRLQGALNLMAREIQGTSPARLAAPGNGGTGFAVTFQTRVAIADPAGLLESDWGPVVSYALQGSDLVRTENGDSRVVADRVASLVVTRDPARPRVTLRVTVFARNPDGRHDQPVAATAAAAVTLRNP